MPKLIDLTGRRYGRLTVLGRDATLRGREVAWVVRCDCGTEKTVRGQALRQGRTIGCGCAQLKHGHARVGRVAAEHRIWSGMLSRCGTNSGKNGARYAGRGITVCARWEAFENFLADMGPRPSPTHSIDRINNDGNYEPGNCRWATARTQANNRRSAVLVNLAGESMTLTEAARAAGLSPELVHTRRKQGWDLVRALTEAPVSGRKGLLSGSKHKLAKLSEESVRALRLRYSAGATQRALAKEYGVSQSIVSEIVQRKRWTHVA